MTEYIKTKDGILHTVSSRKDFSDLLVRYMGVDTSKLFAKLSSVKVEYNALPDILQRSNKLKKSELIEELKNLL